ncbi:hypothetical protein [Metabacillus fastidiosus]|uniref:hypothetical protein n=1 Tax=Metabacillus fastidiosus TaxID=1458 RepID=UPI003D294D32
MNCGKFACGRVIEKDPDNTKGFLAGLMDWIGDNPPTAENLKGYKTLKQGSVHIKTIHETGLDGSILGYRPLNSDNIESDYFLSQLLFDDSCILMKDYKELRKPTTEEAEVTLYFHLGDI